MTCQLKCFYNYNTQKKISDLRLMECIYIKVGQISIGLKTMQGLKLQNYEQQKQNVMTKVRA